MALGGSQAAVSPFSSKYGNLCVAIVLPVPQGYKPQAHSSRSPQINGETVCPEVIGKCFIRQSSLGIDESLSLLRLGELP